MTEFRQKEFNLVSWAVFLMVFVKYPKFSDASFQKVQIQIIRSGGQKQPTSIQGQCCGSIKKHYKAAKTFTLDCNASFWNTGCYISLNEYRDVSADQVTVTGKKSGEKYIVSHVKSLQYLRFHYTMEELGDRWKIVVNTGNNSGIVIGRIYLQLYCNIKNGMVVVPLSNSFDNFEAGRTDTFEFKARQSYSNAFCVSIKNTLPFENWTMSSMILTNIEKKRDYTFYRGERTYSSRFYIYNGNDSVNWEIEVVTGAVGTDCTIDIVLISENCQSKLTLDNMHDNFQPYSTDIFNVQAKNCSALQEIKIGCQDQRSSWVLVKVNATEEDGNSYVFYHNETLETTQVFYVNQSSGNIKWNVSVCTESSSDKMFFIILYGRYGTTKKLRLTTPEDDFQTGQCSHFNLSLKDIGQLWLIVIEKDTTLLISTITLTNNQNSYEFITSSRTFGRTYQFPYYKKGSWIFSPHLPKGGKIERGCADACLKNSCRQFSVIKNECVLGLNTDNSIKTYKMDPLVTGEGRSMQFLSMIWSLDILFPIPVSGARIVFINYHSYLTYPIPMNTATFHQTFSTLNPFFNEIEKVRLDKMPTNDTCKDININMTKTTATNEVILKFEWIQNCLLRAWELREKTTEAPKPNTSLALTWALPTNTQSTNSTLITDSTTYPNNTIELSTVPYSTISITNDSITNSSITEVEIPDKGRNRTICKCFREQILTKEEQKEKMKALVKELKVNKNQTNSYLRSKTSAPDDRASSKVIGSTAVIIMVVPFGLIVLVDLIPILSLFYQKVVSLL